MAGIRQVDDLLLFVAYKRLDTESKEFAQNIVRKVLLKESVYHGGLELEEQKLVFDRT